MAAAAKTAAAVARAIIVVERIIRSPSAILSAIRTGTFGPVFEHWRRPSWAGTNRRLSRNELPEGIGIAVGAGGAQNRSTQLKPAAHYQYVACAGSMMPAVASAIAIASVLTPAADLRCGPGTGSRPKR